MALLAHKFSETKISCIPQHLALLEDFNLSSSEGTPFTYPSLGRDNILLVTILDFKVVGLGSPGAVPVESANCRLLLHQLQSSFSSRWGVRSTTGAKGVGGIWSNLSAVDIVG
ncbi:hypothetical protein CPSG_00901 [Coccidioides posadasii str. Silveira]|uniref:Uncharacterized protein n=1 Tax=Coccidioides posadasii (strain RMSCC 757 / Silveira) TaxID=443226 RepID=E9CTR2_COCPS|nr:hypothetical protein CPSG_00901 [Coccidioides posadasii str. Silveira]